MCNLEEEETDLDRVKKGFNLKQLFLVICIHFPVCEAVTLPRILAILKTLKLSNKDLSEKLRKEKKKQQHSEASFPAHV